VAAEVEGGAAVLRVRDNGRGIEPDIIGHIFEMFVQGPQSVLQAGGGLGVGLALARRIAELHGAPWKLTAKAQVRGVNSRFDFASWIQH
jgi:signal transduction histidine kinase